MKLTYQFPASSSIDRVILMLRAYHKSGIESFFNMTTKGWFQLDASVINLLSINQIAKEIEISFGCPSQSPTDDYHPYLWYNNIGITIQSMLELEGMISNARENLSNHN